MKKDTKIVYSEPKEYFSEEARKIFENADRSKTLLSWLVKDKKYYIYDTGCDSLLDFIEIREDDTYVLDGPRVESYKILLTNEHNRVYEVVIDKKECEKLIKLDEDELLKLTLEIINSKEPEFDKPTIKLLLKN